MTLSPSRIACAFFFSLLPAISAGGAMGIPLLLGATAIALLRPSHLSQLVENKSLFVTVLVSFAGWAAVSALWSDYPDRTQAAQILALVALGLVFAAAVSRSSVRDVAQAGGIAAFAVLALLLIAEALWGMPINQAANPDVPPSELIRNVNRGATVILALTWVAAGALAARGRLSWAGAVICASGFLALPFDLLANLAAFAVGLGVFAVAFMAPRFALLSVTGGLAAWMLAAPFVTPLILSQRAFVDALPLSWAARAGIWDYVCARILEQPWIGHGLDASRAVTDRIQVRDLDMRAVSLHPHSASLQVWFETGAVGAVLAATALIIGGMAMARALKQNRVAAAAAAASLASLGLMANLSFSLWQEWWMALLFVVAALVAALAEPQR